MRVISRVEWSSALVRRTIAVIALLSVVALPFDAKAAPPNVIVLVVDDLGWTDLDLSMDPRVPDAASDYYETPNLSALAQRSFRFSQAYSASPICTPSRASLLTGMSPQALKMTDIMESRPGSRRFSDLYSGKRLIPPLPVKGLPAEAVTIAEYIRDNVRADYATAHFGKWHVGGGGPVMHGFEEGDGPTGNHSRIAHSPDPNPKDVYGLTGRSVAFIEAQVNSGRPFFLQISHYANHVPLSAMQETIAKYRDKPKGERHTNPVYAALNENMDSSVGSLLSALDRLGIADNTYIIVLSDNGGSKNIKNPMTNNAPLREGKTWNYEGGIRVPMFVSGPGLKPGVSHTPVIGWDIFPTVCSILGCDKAMPDAVEGGDVMPIVRGELDAVVRKQGATLAWHFPHYLAVKGTTPNSAIRVGQYKLVKFYEDGRSELYDLASDLGEAKDISADHPDIVARLNSLLEQHLEDVDAPMAKPNDSFGAWQ